jgi:hypothetical protein
MLPAFVERYQLVVSDSSLNECFHDAYIFLSWEGYALVDYVQIYAQRIDFFPKGLDP